MEASDYQEAADQFRFLLRSAAASKNVFDGLAFSLMKIGNSADAIELSEKSIQQFGPEVRVFTCLGYL